MLVIVFVYLRIYKWVNRLGKCEIMIGVICNRLIFYLRR